MTTRAQVIRIASGLPGTEQRKHFDRLAFYAGKRIYATLHPTDRTANVKLSLPDQDSCSKAFPSIYPVPGGWGRMGWTTIELNEISAASVKEIFQCAHALAIRPRKHEVIGKKKR